MYEFSLLEKTITKGIGEQLFTNCAVAIGNKNGEVFRKCFDNGTVKTNEHSLFDLASVTKLVATTMVSLYMIDNGKLKLSDSIGDFLPCPEDKKNITVKELLTHTSGFGGGGQIRDKAPVPYNLPNVILESPLLLPAGKDVIYSCHGFIVLGKILEKAGGNSLDLLCKKHVLTPLGMVSTSYFPKGDNIICSNPHISRRGIVNDLNAAFMGGVAGNAGLFSCIDDMGKFALMLAEKGDGIISKSLFNEAISCHTRGMAESRGLGFNLVDSRYAQTGKLFSHYSYGHTGHTGTSVFVDKITSFYVVILTNRTFYEKDYSLFIDYRSKMHNAIYDDLNSAGYSIEI